MVHKLKLLNQISFFVHLSKTSNQALFGFGAELRKKYSLVFISKSALNYWSLLHSM